MHEAITHPRLLSQTQNFNSIAFIFCLDLSTSWPLSSLFLLAESSWHHTSDRSDTHGTSASRFLKHNSELAGATGDQEGENGPAELLQWWWGGWSGMSCKLCVSYFYAGKVITMDLFHRKWVRCYQNIFLSQASLSMCHIYELKKNMKLYYETVCTWNEQESEAHAWNWVNQTVRFYQTDGSQGCRWALTRCFFSDQVMSECRRCVIHDNFGGWSGS
jgi:hypothetical protein